ncbi:MAG: hypothetical protein ACK5OB_09045, partial [Pirellula sp.]
SVLHAHLLKRMTCSTLWVPSAFVILPALCLTWLVRTMTVQKIFPTQIEPGSIADQLLKRGREEGREEGFEQGREEGLEQGREQGELFGRIRTLQSLLNATRSTDEELRSHSQADLEALASELQAQLRQRMM